MQLKHLGWVLSLSCLLTVSTSFSQQVAKWDSTYRPGDYMLHYQEFQSFPNAKSDIIFLGNSITARGDWSELLGMNNVRNRGISGDITFGVLQRLAEVTEGQPAKVFVLIGINDISRNIPDSVILGNYYKIVHRIKKESPRTKIYFQTLMPVNRDFKKFKNHYNKDEHILWLNEEIKKMGKKENIEIIDLYPHFIDADKKMISGYTIDGLHINIKGYHVWRKILQPYLH